MNNREIAEATLRYIDEFGLENVSFRKVSAYLDIPYTTIYNRFKSKESLLNAVLEVMLDEIEFEETANEPWCETQKRIVRMFRSMALAHPNAFPLFIYTSPFHSPLKELAEKIQSYQSNQLGPDFPDLFFSILHSFQVGFFVIQQHILALEHDGTKESEAALREYQKVVSDEAFERDLDIIVKGMAQVYNLDL